MAELSAAATGEDRTHLLAAFASPETATCLVRDDGTLGGFVVRAPWGGGSTIAPRLEDAEAILHARRVGRGPEHRIRAGLLAENEAGLERLLATGWTESWSAPRLIRGEPLRWQPEAIWGQFNHAARLSEAGDGGRRRRSIAARMVQRARSRAAEGVMAVSACRGASSSRLTFPTDRSPIEPCGRPSPAHAAA